MDWICLFCGEIVFNVISKDECPNCKTKRKKSLRQLTEKRRKE